MTFFQYYISAGCFSLIIALVLYKRIKATSTVLDVINREVFFVINFFFGFISAPIYVVMLTKICWHLVKIWRLERTNKQLRKRNP